MEIEILHYFTVIESVAIPGRDNRVLAFELELVCEIGWNEMVGDTV